MTEIGFPLLGTAIVVLVVLPVSALIAKAGLVMLERTEMGGPLRGISLRYVLLTGSSALPLAWFLSAALHQAETGKSALACLFEHHAEALCFETGFFALALTVTVLACSFGALRGYRGVQASSSDSAAALASRLEEIVAKASALALLRGRIIVTEDDGVAIGTNGILEPRVFVGVSFAARLSDEMLESALGHEWAHVRARDPLRYLVLQIALAVNPIGRALLESHAARWRAAREVHCDREAVIGGAAPLSLADAILRAARPTVREAVALGARDTAVLEFRIGLLLAFAQKAPGRYRYQGPSAFPAALGLLLVALLLPHQTGTAALDMLHTCVEHALIFVWR